MGVGGFEGALHYLFSGPEGTSGDPASLGKDPLKVMVGVQVAGQSPARDVQRDT